MRLPLEEQARIPVGVEHAHYDVETIRWLADGFKALADETRLRIIRLLMTRGEMCVCKFMPLLGLTQSNVSFHLMTLKHAGFITSRKEGRWMLYSLNRKAFEQFHASFGDVFDQSMWRENADFAACT
jgi:ArsR family transcriptional regulator